MVKRLFLYKWYIAVILILVIAEPSVTSWLVLCLQKIYNNVTIGTPRLEILRLILIGVMVWISKRLLLFAISVIKSRFLNNIKQDLKHDIFTSIFGLKTASISHIAASGEYISIFTNDIVIIEQRFFSQIISLASKLFSIVILSATFFHMNRKLACIVVGFSVLAMFVPPVFAKALSNTNLVYSNTLSRFTQKLKEYFQAYFTVKNFSIEKTIIDRFDHANESVENTKFIYDCSLSLADSIGSLFTWFAQILIIGSGLVMVANGEILLGTVIAAQSFSEEIASPLQGIIENINSIKSVKAIVGKIESLTTESCEKNKDNICLDKLANKLNIEFRHFSIPINGRNIVDNFSFEFKQGGKYLVIGKNGSGKSSIFKALKKYFEKYDGEIIVNGVELKSIPNGQLSHLVTYLAENVSIFSGTVEENITIWRKISKKYFHNAVQRAHIELDPNRSVGEDGFNISSGEQRRIEIARSLVCPSKIMIFDEVVSTLDIETAFDIERMILGYADKTVIFISHNFSGKLMREYDEILVIKDGKLVAHGNYEELIRTSEYFRKICEIKFGEHIGFSKD